MDDFWGIEKCWGVMAEKRRGKSYASIAALKRAMIRIWKTFDVEWCQNLMDGHPKRAQAIIDNEGHRILKRDC